MTTIQERKKCNKCRVNLLFKEFKPKRNGTLTKRCIKCLDYNNKWQQKNKCEHNRQKAACKDCKGYSRNKNKCSRCKKKYYPDLSILWNGKPLQTCNKCRLKCKHGEYGKKNCIECKLYQICEHNKIKSRCKECDPQGHLAHIVRNSVYRALQSDKEKHSIEYLGCSIQHFREHIEKQFIEGMNWDNYGEWQIDHIIPLKYENPTIEETIERLHWENTQPLWATDNIVKGNRYIG